MKIITFGNQYSVPAKGVFSSGKSERCNDVIIFWWKRSTVLEYPTSEG